MVFTEFIEFVEDSYGFDVANTIIEEASLVSKGVYTSVGTYDSAEFVGLVKKLSEITNTEIPELLINYGKHLFQRFVVLYPQFFHPGMELFDFLGKIDNYIHIEVKKLYPDAELPSIETIDRGANFINLCYSSKRKFSDFGFGLLLGAVDYFKENIDIKKELLIEDGSKVSFILTRIK